MPDRRSESVATAVREVVHRGGYDLEGVEVTSAAGRRAVAVVIDRDGGVSLDALAAMTRDISAQLDADDPFGDAEYTLEVTTPGIDRPLTEPRHWRRAAGRRARIRLVGGEDVLARIGALDSTGDQVDLVIADRKNKKGPQIRRVELSAVDHAVVEVEFSPPSAAELALCGVGSPEDAGSASGPGVAHSAAAEEEV